MSVEKINVTLIGTGGSYLNIEEKNKNGWL